MQDFNARYTNYSPPSLCIL
uniref:Uncharacterized protein n=1 Tax=Anguilla anguilla TaxID=7936 RepID=A0A0E9V0A4_ANGAN